MPSSGIFPTQGSNPYLLWLLHWWILYCWPPGKPNFYKQKSDWPKNMKRCSTAMKLKWTENNALFHTHQIGINFKMWQYPVLSRIWNRGLTSTDGGSKMFHKTHERTIQYYLRFCNIALYTFLIKNSSSRYNPCRISHSYEQEKMDKNSHCSVVCNRKKTSCSLIG